MANSYKASLRETKKKQQVNTSAYPFINPIICIKDENGEIGVFDGNNRVEVCKKLEVNPNSIIINEVYESAEFWEKYHSIKANQKKELEKYFKVNNVDFLSQIEMSSSDDRMGKFIDYVDNFKKDRDYWEQLSTVYQSMNNSYKLKEEIKNLFQAKRPEKESLMNAEELKQLSKLPEIINIYRGMTIIEKNSGNYGMSWSIDEQVAKKFAEIFPHNYDSRGLEMTVEKKTINKKDVVAYFIGRDESEIIYIS
jgi:hypothetical protein